MPRNLIRHNAAWIIFSVLLLPGRHSAARDSEIPPPTFFICSMGSERMPEFPGGDDSLKAFVSKNCQYPVGEFDTIICRGKVIMQFTVNEEGVVCDIKVIKKSHPAFDAEAIRVIKLLPQFKPGTQFGKPIKTTFNLPLIFSLE